MGKEFAVVLMNRRIRKWRAEKLPAILFLLPSLGGFLLFFLIPFLAGAGYALTDSPVNGKFVGLKNIAALFGNSAFLIAMKNTLLFMAPSVFLGLLLPLAAALILKHAAYAGKAISMLFLSPMAIPAATVALFWQIFFDFRGPMNHLLGRIGIKPLEWLAGPWGLAVVIVVYLWKYTGYNMIIYFAGLGNIPSEYYEAADIDGAGRIGKLLFITLPGLVPTGFFVLTISVVNCFRIFREIYLIFGAYPNENVYMLQNFMNNMFLQLNYPKLTSGAYVAAAFITVLLLVLFVLERKAEESFA
jgi:multiple sugar transport system permease protein